VEPELRAAPPWHLAEGADGPVALAPADAVGGVAVSELFATGAAVPLMVSARPKPAAGAAEAVVYVAPAATGTWCRVDLRLTVRDGEAGDLALAAPFVRDADLQVHADGFTLMPADGGDLRLHAAAPWRGERLLRIEGHLPGAASALPRIAVRASADANAGDLPLRVFAAVQAPAGPDLKLTADPGAVAVGEDDLPAWSHAIPGAPVAAAWRLEGAASVGWTAVPRPPAALPAGFVDRLEIATRIDARGPHGGMTLVRALVAAPGRQHLALRLPPGETLAQATIDAATVAVARGPDGALLLPLPGRTQVQLALLLSEDIAADGPTLALPSFAPLQVVRCTWTVALAGPWRVRAHGAGNGPGATAADAIDLLPGALLAPGPERPWYAPWTLPAECVPAGAAPFALPALPGAGSADPRQLAAPAAAAPAPAGEPVLALSGRTWLRWQRLDGDGVMRLSLADIEDLRWHDRLGWMLGALLGLGLALRARYPTALLVGFAAWIAALALHGWDLPAAGALAVAEALPVAVGAGWLLRLGLAAWRRPASAPRAPAPALALLALGLALAGAGMSAAGAAEAPEPVLMGYQRLDAAGLPAGVQVALTRAQLQALWQRAQPAPGPGEPCALALGGVDLDLRLDGGRLVGTATFDCAAFGSYWQDLRLGLGAGHVEGISVLPPGAPLPPAVLALGRAGAAAPPPWTLPAGTTLEAGDGTGPTVGWRMDGDQVVLALASGHQWRIAVALALPVTARDGGWAVDLPWLPAAGGTLRLRAAPGGSGATAAAHAPGMTPTLNGMDLALDGRAGAPGTDGAWRWDLPATGVLALTANPRAPGAPPDGRLELTQSITVALAPGHLEWQDEAQIASAVAPPRRVVLALPAGLAVTAAAGPGLAAWHQDAAALTLEFADAAPSPLALRLLGALVVPPGVSSAAVVPDLPGAARSAGRLALRHGDGRRFANPAGLERADPAPGEDLAARWDGGPGAPAVVAWSAVSADVAIEERCTLVCGRDRLRVGVHVDLRGPGALGALYLRLPGPWRLAADPAPVDAAFSGGGDDRLLVVRPPQPLRAGAGVDLALEAERSDIGNDFTAPDLAPVAGGGAPAPELARQRWCVGDAGDLRLTRTGDGAQGALAGGVEALAAETGAQLRPGETWRLACERQGAPPRFRLVPEAVQATVAASHYLVVGAERVRWSARLDWTVTQGDLAELRCTLPPSAHLVRLHAADLGSWHLEGTTLVATLTAPARAHAALELELEAALADAAQIAAIATEEPLVAQQVAAVAEDDIGLLHFNPEGLESGPGASALALPDGVDAALVADRWHALRPDWHLGIARETLAATGGVDGVATLVEVAATVAPDRELRAHALWHLLNRSRQQLPLRLPDGVDLWEVRLDGAAVHPSADPGDPTLMWVPARTLRPGEAALRLEVTWRERVAGTVFSPALPRFAGVTINQVIWRLAAPPPWRLEWRSGGLKPVTALTALGVRAHNVIDELARLRQQDGLKEAGLRRLGDQLSALDLELADYQAGADAAPAAAQADSDLLPFASLRSNRDQVRDDRQRLELQFNLRAQRRNSLGLGNLNQTWSNQAASANNAAQVNAAQAAPANPQANGGQTPAPAPAPGAAPTGDFAPPVAVRAAPWRAPLALAAGAGLGAGEVPPGWRQAAASEAIGMDLVALPADAAELDVGGSGQDPTLRLALVAPAASPWPAVGLGLAVVVLAGAALLHFWRPRPRPRSRPRA
jgi:hypothetical protein